MSVALFGHGTKLQRGNGATTEAFTEIPLAADIALDLPATQLIPYPDQSDSTRFEKSIAGKIKGGKVSTTIGFNPVEATHVAIETDALAGTIGNYRVIPNTGQGFAFAGLPSLKHNYAEDSYVSSTLEISITGAVTRV